MITQDDKNRMVFWILKRHTSYTAWKRATDAFEKAYQAMKKVRPLLLSAPKGKYGREYQEWNDWPMWPATEETREEMLYCIYRLRQGDKSVLSYMREVGDAKTFDSCAYFIKMLYDDLIGNQSIRDGWYADWVPIFPDQENITKLITTAALLSRENIAISRTEALKLSTYSPINLLKYPTYLYSTIVGPPHILANADAFTTYPIPTELEPVPQEPVLFPDQPPPGGPRPDSLKGLMW